jgi:hypothetical protein
MTLETDRRAAPGSSSETDSTSGAEAGSSAATNRRAAAGASGADLDWVLGALWGGSSEVEVAMARDAPARRRVVERFAVFPKKTRPRLLLPLGSGGAASRALHDHTSHRKLVRMAKPLMANGMRTGLARRLVRNQMSVSIAEDTPAEALPRLLLKEHLREVMGRDIETAIKFIPRAPHRKPTMQILSPSGEVLGYVKVGWNQLTRELVRNEAHTLEVLGRRQPRAFEVPRVLYAGRWRGLELLMLAPVALGPRRRRRPLLRKPPIEATSELGSIRGAARGPLAESEYWAGIEDRTARAAHALDGRSSFGLVVEQLGQRYGATTLPYGFWHGDWVPWNMGQVGARLYVWDWERSGPLAPLGLDALHFEYQVALFIRKLPPVPATHHVLERPACSLHALRLPESLRPLLLCLHLLEMALRFEEAQAAGIDILDRRYRQPLETLLR